MPETIDSLVIEIEGQSTNAVSALEKLEKTLERIKTVAKGGISGLNTSAKHIIRFQDAVDNLNLESVKRIKEISKPISDLKLSVQGGLPGLRTSAKHIQGFQDVIDKINLSNANKLYTAIDPLLRLKEIGNIKITSTITQIKKLGDLSTELENVDLDKFSGKIQRYATALEPLANQMNKISSGFNALPRSLQKIVTKTYESTNAIKKNNLLLFKNVLSIGTVIRIGRGIADLITKSSEYTENMNLFNVAMGEYAEEAAKYTQTVSDIMGIDPSEWMRSQGVFMTLATGFGVVGDRAYLMSKNLTQLGYDIASFYNISVEESMQKLKSGFAGELEPLALAA